MVCPCDGTSAGILAVSQHFLLLRIDRDGGLPTSLASHDPAVDVLELRVPIWVLLAFPGLAIRLQAVALPFQEFRNLCTADLETLTLQLGGQGPRALASPPQRRHRISSRFGFYESLQLSNQRRLFHFPGRATGTGPSLSIARKRVRRLEFLNPVAYGTIRDSRAFGDGGDSTPAQRDRLARRPTAPSAFIEFARQRGELGTNPFDNRCFRHCGSIP